MRGLQENPLQLRGLDIYPSGEDRFFEGQQNARWFGQVTDLIDAACAIAGVPSLALARLASRLRLYRPAAASVLTLTLVVLWRLFRGCRLLGRSR